MSRRWLLDLMHFFKDRCCGSGIFIAYPDYFHRGSRILIFINPGSGNSNKRGEKVICCLTCSCSHKFLKVENYFIFEQVQIFFSQLTKNYSTFYPNQKFVTMLSKIMVGDPAGIGDPGLKKPIPDPGSRGQKGTGSQIHDPEPQRCKEPNTSITARF